MGAGKSTIGQRLAKALGKEFVDSDHEIEERNGVSISTIFDIEGEDGFRKREAACITELSCREGLVLATGGGSVLIEENRKQLSANGLVIYLRASAEQLHKRTKGNKSRPLLLQSKDPKAKLQQLLDERDPLYRKIADIVVETDNRPIQQAIPQLITAINEIQTKDEAEAEENG